MKQPKGPELKMPPLKAPAFLTDLYYDLRDRRLLPLVALVLVAIVATPILLGQKSEAPPPIGGGAVAALKGASRGRGAELTVVQAKPGLRAYRLRLRGRKPTDPFRKPKPKPAPSGSKSGGGAAGSSAGFAVAPVTSTSTTVQETSSTTKTTKTESTKKTNGSPAAFGGAGAGGESGAGSHQTLYTWAADLTIVHSSGSEAEGDKQSDPPMKFTGILGPTTLPSEKTQVVTYLGRSPKTHRATFLVSSEVTGVFGEGKCVAGTGTCQLIELETGFPEIFEFGEGADRYTVKVTKLEPVPNGHT